MDTHVFDTKLICIGQYHSPKIVWITGMLLSLPCIIAIPLPWEEKIFIATIITFSWGIVCTQYIQERYIYLHIYYCILYLLSSHYYV